MKDNLSHIYAAFKDNGIVDIGLQSALDIGMKECDYIVVQMLFEASQAQQATDCAFLG